jgi:4-alpha-glucanotransferase
LWFERDGERFRPPHEWSREAVGMTATHDTPTAAGWWCGRDIDWRERLNLCGAEPAQRDRAARAADRQRLWSVLQASGSAEGELSAPDQPERFVDAACAHVARSACELAMVPLEDLLGQVEQPNLPGTIGEHPNWRRRYPGPAAQLLAAPAVRARLRAVAATRRG